MNIPDLNKLKKLSKKKRLEFLSKVLNSGLYKEGFVAIREEDKYDVFGVATELYILAENKKWNKLGPFYYCQEPGNCPHKEVQDYFGLSNRLTAKLIWLCNQRKKSHKFIAKFIRRVNK